MFNKEQRDLQVDGCKIEVSGIEMPLKVNVASTMMDMKAAHLYLGLGGAYCDLCHSSRNDAHDPKFVEECCNITRSIEDLHNLFGELVQDDGSVFKQVHDYQHRAGLTSKPVPTNETKSVQVLHALLRCFHNVMKVAVHI